MILLIVVQGLAASTGARADDAPPNDTRANATVVEVLPYTAVQSTEGASLETFEMWACEYSGASVWYEYTPTEDQDLVADTLGSDFDTVLAVYEGSNPIPVGCNVDTGGTKQSRVSIAARAGIRYLFQISGTSWATGALVFTLDAIRAPANDGIGAAEPIDALPFVDRVATELATAEGVPCAEAAATAWWSYTPGVDTDVVFDTLGSDVDTVIAVYGQNLSVVECRTILGGRSVVGIEAQAGQTYFVQAGALLGSRGHLVLQASLHPRTGLDAIAGLPATRTANTSGVPTVSGDPRPCGGIGAAVWYRFTAPTTGPVIVDTYGSDFDTAVAVYDWSDPVHAIACNDDGQGRFSDLQFHAMAGASYLIQGGGWRGGTGDLVVNVRPGTDATPPPIAWPDPEQAFIRPGARIFMEGGGQCTANFVFRGTGHRSDKLYLGTAAHCVGNGIGRTIRIGQTVIGAVAYSGWKEPDRTGNNDFALIEIWPEHHGRVHPAMIHFGGPTGVAPLEDIRPGQPVLTYGNSGLRQSIHEANKRQGYVTGRDTDWTVNIFTVSPGVWGDSGSATVLGDGRALGVLVTLAFAPPGGNGVTVLSTALDLAREIGWGVELQTWEILDPGLLPAGP